MRIIAGKARGHKLVTPRDMQIRPTSDRVKESIFNIIQSRINDSIVIDLFSGTGNLGIEALSRNARKAYFIDYSRESIEIIKKNLKKTNFTLQAEVLLEDIIVGIDKLSKKNVKADIIFMDPPYDKGLTIVTLEHIVKKNLLYPWGIIIIEHGKVESMPEEIEDIICFRRKDYGNTRVSFYIKKEEI